MQTWIAILRWMDTGMETPKAWGGFHLVSWLLMILAIAALCLLCRKCSHKQVCDLVLGVALTTLLLEIYKQINYTFGYDTGVVVANYQWYAFPFQFCSTPMYVGLLAGIFRKGKFHDCLCAYLASYAVFAGLCVMIYPGDVFCGTVGINIQTMFWHGSMVVLGVFLLASGHVKLEHKTILRALPVFAVMALVAVVLNEIAYYTGLVEEHYFNMFYFSRHCEPHLPVYSLVQEVVPYPLSLMIYVLGFSIAAYLILLIAMGAARLLCSKKACVAQGV